MATKAQQLSKALLVKNETKRYANTAIRVGGLFDDIVNSSVNWLLIESVDDLTPYLSGDEYVLPENTLVIVNGTVNIGERSIRISTGTVLRGFANANIIYSGEGGAVVSTNVGSAVIIRELNIVSVNGGQCLNLQGTIDHQLNVFFVGLFGVKGGTITGFDVQAFKDCFINSADGLTLRGTTNKIFVSACPFFGVTSSAITLHQDLVCDVVDIVTSFFKFEAPGVGITAQEGYQVSEGRISGSLIQGTTTALSGFSPSDVNWQITGNSGLADSRITGGYFLNAKAQTVITTIDTPVKVAGTTTGYALNERFTTTNNRLTYTGARPAVVDFKGTFSVSTANNTNLSFYISKNGVIQSESRSRVRVGAGLDERAGTVTDLIEMVAGDFVEIWVENNDSTANVTCLALNLNGQGL
jgi:hypothetical protein